MQLTRTLRQLSFLAPAALAALFAIALFAYTTASAQTYDYGNTDDSSGTSSMQNNEYGSYESYGGYGYSQVYGLSTDATQLDGENEVPPVDSDTSGDSSISFFNNGSNMAISLSVSNGEDITMAHLHCGTEGENGPPVVTLFEYPQGVDVDGPLVAGVIGDDNIADADCASVIGYDIGNVSDLAQALLAGDIYINVHSIEHPDGVARGQFFDDNSDDGNDDDGTDESGNGSDENDDQDSNY